MCGQGPSAHHVFHLSVFQIITPTRSIKLHRFISRQTEERQWRENRDGQKDKVKFLLCVNSAIFNWLHFFEQRRESCTHEWSSSAYRFIYSLESVWLVFVWIILKVLAWRGQDVPENKKTAPEWRVKFSSPLIKSLPMQTFLQFALPNKNCRWRVFFRVKEVMLLFCRAHETGVGLCLTGSAPPPITCL